jgi:hypothetical protein
MNTESKDIAMFPLNILLLPGEQLPLHIFEPKYQQLFDEAEQNSIPFALPYSKNGVKLASKCRLLQVTKRLPGGVRDVIIECTHLHSLERQEPVFATKLYPGGVIGAEIELRNEKLATIQLLELFADFIEIKYGKRPVLEEILRYRTVDVAACIAMSNEDKTRFVIAQNELERERLLTGLIKYMHFLYFQESQAENGILLN